MISIRTYAAANTARLVVTGDNFPVIAGLSVLLLQHSRLAHVRSEETVQKLFRFNCRFGFKCLLIILYGFGFYSKTLLVLKSIEPVWLSIPDSYLLSRGRDLFE